MRVTILIPAALMLLAGSATAETRLPSGASSSTSTEVAVLDLDLEARATLSAFGKSTQKPKAAEGDGLIMATFAALMVAGAVASELLRRRRS